MIHVMLANAGQTIAVVILVSGAVVYPALQIRRAPTGQRGCGSCGTLPGRRKDIASHMAPGESP